MHRWTDETKIPVWLLKLLKVPGIPEDLRKELLQSQKEVEELGAVNYPTKARIEYLLHQHHDYLTELLEKLEET